MVTDRQNNRQQGNTKNATRAPFPDEDQASDQQHGIKQGISTDERHDRIEKRIGQFRVDEAKQVGVHRGSLGLNARTLKTFQSIDDYRADRMILELVAPAQEAQLDKEGNFQDFGPELLHQGGGGGGRSPRGQQIVDQ